jgi:hypothetical protein
MIESPAFKAIMNKIDRIEAFVPEIQKENETINVFPTKIVR